MRNLIEEGSVFILTLVSSYLKMIVGHVYFNNLEEKIIMNSHQVLKLVNLCVARCDLVATEKLAF